jgi:putative membrane protein
MTHPLVAARKGGFRKQIAHILFIAQIEARFLMRFPRMLVACLVVALIPALYAVIYLSSVWDPAAKTGALPVALVNLDRGMEYHDSNFNIGWEVLANLRTSNRFGYRSVLDAEDARRQVRDGKIAFALIIPEDFSSNALPGAEPGGGKLVVYTSEGNNYQSAALARHFAEELGHQVNERLNERRWALVLANAAGSQRSVDRLRQGVQELQQGAKELSGGAKAAASGAKTVHDGANQLSEGVGQLSTGFKQLGEGLRTMDAKRPRNSDLTRLQTGAEALANGHAELGKGLIELHTGSQKLRTGVTQYRDEAKSSLLVSTQVAEGMDQLADGMTQLDTGLQSAHGAQQQLADGANRLNAGVGELTNGIRALNAGLRTAVGKLPEDRQLDALGHGAVDLAEGTAALAEGTQKIKAGSQRLAVGMDLLADALPASLAAPEGSAQGLANSVRPQMEVEAPVENNGSSFAPNVIPAALWLGAGIVAFLFNVRAMPRQARFFSVLAQLLGKMLLPAVVVVVQALLVMLTVRFALNIPILHLPAFLLTLVTASLTFLLIVFALTRAFGDAGKGLAMLFLAIQLTSSGGVLPIELSGTWFMNLSPWLPLTWEVRALKATLFGAYGGAWGEPLLHVAVAGLVAAIVACTVGRWRFVKTAALRPAVDF